MRATTREENRLQLVSACRHWCDPLKHFLPQLGSCLSALSVLSNDTMSARLGYHVFDVDSSTPAAASAANMLQVLGELASELSEQNTPRDTVRRPAWLTQPVDTNAACFVPPFLPTNLSVMTGGECAAQSSAQSPLRPVSAAGKRPRSSSPAETGGVSAAWHTLPSAPQPQTDWAGVFSALALHSVSFPEAVALTCCSLLRCTQGGTSPDGRISALAIPAFTSMDVPSLGAFRGASAECQLALLASLSLFAASCSTVSSCNDAHSAPGIAVESSTIPILGDAEGQAGLPAQVWFGVSAACASRASTPAAAQPAGALQELIQEVWAGGTTLDNSESALQALFGYLQGGGGAIDGAAAAASTRDVFWLAVRKAGAIVAGTPHTSLGRHALGVSSFLAAAVDAVPAGACVGSQAAALQQLLSMQPRLLRRSSVSGDGDCAAVLQQQRLVVLRMLRKASALVAATSSSSAQGQASPAAAGAALKESMGWFRPLLPMVVACMPDPPCLAAPPPARRLGSSAPQFKSDVAAAAERLLRVATAGGAAPMCALGRACLRLAQR